MLFCLVVVVCGSDALGFVPILLLCFRVFSFNGICFFFRLWLENTVFFDVLAFLVELRGWFAWCSWGPLLLLPFALGLSLVRLWPHFGLRVLSRQLYRQELMAELSALCWGSPLFTSYSSSWQFVAWIFLSFFFVCTSSVHLSLCTRCGS